MFGSLTQGRQLLIKLLVLLFPVIALIAGVLSTQSADADAHVLVSNTTASAPLKYAAGGATCDMWRIVNSAWVPSVYAAHFEGVSAVAANDVWVVGYNYHPSEEGSASSSRTLVQHWNGTEWSLVPSPNGPEGNGELHAVHALASNDAWAVGHYWTGWPFPQRRSLIQHWNGTQWAVVPSPTDSWNVENTLADVTALSSTEVWAVGHTTSASHSPETLVLRWNGQVWTRVPSPNITPAASYFNYLQSVSASASNDIWAVGYYHDSGYYNYRGLLLHWNGTQWSLVPGPNVVGQNNESTNHTLWGVEVVSPTDVWAVGGISFGGSLIQHWNGTQWSVVSNPGGNGNDYDLLVDVAAVSANDVWAVGYSQPAFEPITTLVQHWNGSAWSTVPSPNVAAGDRYDMNRLVDISVVSSKDIWAAGEYRVHGEAEQPLLEHYSTGPCPTATPTRTPLPPTSTPTLTPTPIPTVVGCGLEFADVPPADTFYPYARCLTCKESISGYGCGGTDPWTGAPEPCDEDNKPYFRPGNPVSRGQISKMVSQSAGFEEPIGAQIYEDVPPDSTFYEFVQRLSQREVMGGYPCGQPGTEPCVAPENRPNFRPHSPATRGHISKIVSNAAGFEDEPTTQKFEDVPPTNPFYVWVERLASRHVMGGYPCGSVAEEPCVRPDERPYFRYVRTVTRGQAAKIVSNTFFPNCDQSMPTATTTATMTATPTGTPSAASKGR